MARNIMGYMVLSLIIIGCGASTTSTSTTTTASSSYVGAGSVWDVQMNADKTFTINHQLTAASAIDMTIIGTYATLPSNFLLLTVGSVTGSSVFKPAAGDTAYALEVPGYAFFLKPISSTDTQIVPMVSAGTCPTVASSLNWVSVKSGLAPNNAGNEFFGTVVYDPVAGNITSGAGYALTAGFPVAHAASRPLRQVYAPTG